MIVISLIVHDFDSKSRCFTLWISNIRVVDQVCNRNCVGNPTLRDVGCRSVDFVCLCVRLVVGVGEVEVIV